MIHEHSAVTANRTFSQNEEEYLFAPYSVFRVIAVTWSTGANIPHKITIGAAADNMDHSLSLPLAPFY